MSDISPLSFDSLGGLVDEYFKIYLLDLGKYFPDEKKKDIEDFVIKHIEAGKTAYEGFKEYLPHADNKKIIQKLMKELEKMYQDD
jgi:hypothetical protein